MDVEQFVANALLAIAKGVKKAQADESTGNMVGRLPAHLPAGTAFHFDEARNLVGFVEFDLAVSAETTTEGSAGIKVWAANAGGSVGSQTTHTNRLKFSVPLGYPAPAAQKSELAARDARNEEVWAGASREILRERI